MSITSFTELKNNFNTALDKIENKSALILNEIKEIDDYLLPTQPLTFKNRKEVRSLEKLKQSNSLSVFSLNFKDYHKRVFQDAFNNINIYGSFELPKNDHTEENYTRLLLIIEQAKEFIDYKNWLLDLKEKPSKSIKKPPLTNKQKVLALHYLGVKFDGNDYSKAARLIEPIINYDWNDSRKDVRILFHEDEKLKTKENLNTLLHMFDKESFTEETKKIKIDLEKLD